MLAADVDAVANDVGAPSPAVVGHSLGGFVASVYASAYPTRAIVNVDQPLALAGFKEQLTSIEPMLRSDAFLAVMGQMFDQLAGPLPDAEKQRLMALRRPDPEMVLSIWDPAFSFTVEELDELSRSLLAGKDPRYLTILGDDLGPDSTNGLRSLIRQAEVEVWARDAHYPHLIETDRFVARVKAFLG